MLSKNVLVAIASGTEELEAVAIIDALRRSGLVVRVCSIENQEITGANRIKLVADSVFGDEVVEDYDAIVLPGGTDGAKRLASHGGLQKALKKFCSQNNLVAAICASPALVLAPLGLLDDKRATCYPSFKDELKNYVDDKVVIDGNIITSQGPGTALEFSFALIENLAGQQAASRVRRDMLA